jgi:hypothetical protein
MPVASMLMRFSIGYGQALARPGSDGLVEARVARAVGVGPPVLELLVVIRLRLGQKVACGHLSQAGQAEKKRSTRRVRQRSGSVWSCTTVSIIESGAGSVAVSARPILPCTLATSGKLLISLSVCCSSSLALADADARVGGRHVEQVALVERGMNSVPRRESG